MRTATHVIFRRLTGADFFNIYKPPGAEPGGGGQSYIDIDTSAVPVAVWYTFLAPTKPKLMADDYPAWDVTIQSIGIPNSLQTVRFAQRRDASVSIRSQKLNSRRSNRVLSWHPDHGQFPVPVGRPASASDPAVASLTNGLVVYLVRDSKGDIWAGWFKRFKPAPAWKLDPRLGLMFAEREGYIDLGSGISFDETNRVWPFGTLASKSQPNGAVTTGLVPATRTKSKLTVTTLAKASQIQKKHRSEIEILNALFEEEDESRDASPAVKKRFRKIRNRNTAAVKLLKDLYKGQCQITGEKYVFAKADGVPYTEAHHLIPLGKGGADSPRNIIVVSAHVHKMLHHAKVPQVDLSKIKNNKLEIEINSQKYTITWHPEHAKKVLDAAKES